MLQNISLATNTDQEPLPISSSISNSEMFSSGQGDTISFYKCPLTESVLGPWAGHWRWVRLSPLSPDPGSRSSPSKTPGSSRVLSQSRQSLSNLISKKLPVDAGLLRRPPGEFYRVWAENIQTIKVNNSLDNWKLIVKLRLRLRLSDSGSVTVTQSLGWH